MPRKLLQLIAVASVLRLLLAAMLEFGNDEVYYFLYALDLQPNYFDHPPGVAWLIRISTLNLLLTDEFFVRLGAVACSATGTWLVYRLGTELKNEQTGWYAAILYTANLYTSLIAGTFIIPDSPQVVAWLASLLVMHHILNTPPGQKVPIKQWIQFGVLVGITILCKVHGIFLWGSLGLYLLLYDRRRLLEPGLYLAGVITVIVISPILIWNFQNDFITYRFHSGRVGVEETWIHLDYFFQAVGGQLLYSNPVNSVLILIAAWKIDSMNFISRDSLRFVLVNGLPLVVVVTTMSLFSTMLPHWSGPGMMVLCFLAAAYLDEKASQSEPATEPRVLRITLYVVAGLLVVTLAIVKFYPGTLGSHHKKNFGADDFTLDLSGWGRFADEFTPWLTEQEKSGQIPAGLPFVSNKWFPAAHIEYYVARPINRPVIGIGWVVDVHQYAWLNRERPPLTKGDNALCIVPSNYPMVLDESYYKHFTSIEPLKVFYGYRNGRMTRYFNVYLLKGYKANDEAHEGAFARK